MTNDPPGKLTFKELTEMLGMLIEVKTFWKEGF
jgi:hypothetical protein